MHETPGDGIAGQRVLAGLRQASSGRKDQGEDSPDTQHGFMVVLLPMMAVGGRDSEGEVPCVRATGPPVKEVEPVATVFKVCTYVGIQRCRALL